jgi:hypothetical protein
MSNSITAVDRPLAEFMQAIVKGFKQEDLLLYKAHRNINPSARTLRLAESELAYAYLVRRSLVLEESSYNFEFEKHYRQAHGNQYVDLVLLGPDRTCELGIEIKWVQKECVFPELISDAEKLLAIPALTRRFLLCFPLTIWYDQGLGRSLSDPILTHLRRHYRVELVERGEFLTHSDEPCGVEIPFRIGLFELFGTAKEG